MYVSLAILAAFVLIYSVIAGRVERTWLSGPILFTLFGLACGPEGLHLLSFETDPETLRTLAELTLALVLFTDAASTDLRLLRQIRQLPARLLGIGLPLTIVAGFGVGWLLFGDLTLLEVALLATLLAPTDAALGKGVVTNKAVPAPVREGLTVESGLNDGICVPILFLFLTLAQGQGGDSSPLGIGLGLFLEEIGIGLVVGLALSAAAVGLLRICGPRGWLSPTWSKVTIVALALACYGAAQALGGSGFIASFVGGLLLGGFLKPHQGPLLDASEGIGDTFALVTWVVFGSAVVGQTLGEFTWTALLYGVLSLTVIRMVPVYLALAGLNLGREGKLFIGWFGPRGLASIVFAVLVLGAGLPHGSAVVSVASWTVMLSILAHGVTANPWARRLGARMPAAKGD